MPKKTTTNQHKTQIKPETDLTEQSFDERYIYTCTTITNNYKLEAWIINSLLIRQSLKSTKTQ